MEARLYSAVIAVFGKFINQLIAKAFQSSDLQTAM